MTARSRARWRIKFYHAFALAVASRQIAASLASPRVSPQICRVSTSASVRSGSGPRIVNAPSRSLTAASRQSHSRARPDTTLGPWTIPPWLSDHQRNRPSFGASHGSVLCHRRFAVTENPWFGYICRWHTALSIWRRWWTGPRGVFWPGECRLPWRWACALRRSRRHLPRMAGRRFSIPTRAASLPAPPSPACCWRTRSPSAWTGADHGGTTCLSSGCGGRSNTRRCICGLTTESVMHVPRLDDIWFSITRYARIPALTRALRITPTSILCRTLWQHEFRRQHRAVAPFGLRRPAQQPDAGLLRNQPAGDPLIEGETL